MIVLHVGINVDAEIFGTEQKVILGACLRDVDGNFVMVMTTFFDVVMSPTDGDDNSHMVSIGLL